MDTDKAPIADHNKDGELAQLRAHTPDIVKDNAARVVASLKICGTTAMLFSKNKVFSIAGAGFIAANSIILLFAGKKTEKEKEELRQDGNGTEDKPKGRLASYTSKLLHPHKYPIESGTCVAMLSSTFWTASGIFGKGGFSPGRLIGGLLSLGSDANIVFTKERIGEPEANPNPKGSAAYYVTEMKHRPVLVSSLLNIGCDIATIAGGAYEYSKGKEPNTLLAGIFLFSANAFQSLFVNKNDYNIEGKAAAASTKAAALPTPEPHAPPPSEAKTTWRERTHYQERQPGQQFIA